MKRTLESIGVLLAAFVIVLGLLILVLSEAPMWAINFAKDTSVFTILKDVADLFILLLELSAIVIAIFVVMYVIPRRYRRHKFVFGGINDTQSIATILQRPIDFNKLAMEELVKQDRAIHSILSSQLKQCNSGNSSNNNKKKELDNYIMLLANTGRTPLTGGNWSWRTVEKEHRLVFCDV